MMGFPSSVFVERLIVNCATYFAILRSANNHSVTPCYRLPNRNFLKNAESHIKVYSSFDLFLLVKRDWHGRMTRYGFGITVNHEPHRGPSH
jgi:hypothetical protein